MTTINLFSESFGLVTYQQVIDLSPPVRVGWLTNLVEKSLGLYSDHFLQESLANEFVSYGWQFAESGVASASDANELLKRYYPLVDENAQGIQHDYYTAIRVAPHLVLECLYPFGRYAVSGVESACWALVIRLHWAARTTPSPGDSDPYSQTVISHLYHYAHATLQLASKDTFRRSMFDCRPLYLPRQKSELPPYHEDGIPPYERVKLALPSGVEWETA